MKTIEPIRFETGSAMLLGGIRRTHAVADAGRDIPRQWQEFKSLMPLPGQVGSNTYGAICGGDAQGFEYMACVEVASFDTLPAGLGRMRIQPQQYAVFLHSGAITGISNTWQGAYAWLAQSSWESAHRPDFEVYGERYDAVDNCGDVEIWIAVISK